MTSDAMAALRAATEADVLKALNRAWVPGLPITTLAEALEFFNLMLDHMTGEADRAESEDEARIAKAAMGRAN